MNWLQKISFPMEDRDSGNCGMYAIALGKIAQEQGKKVVIILAADAEETTSLWNDPRIYHVGVEIDGVVYDGSGVTSEQGIARFAYDIYGDPSPHMFYLELDEATITLIRRETNWDTSWEQYYDQMKQDET